MLHRLLILALLLFACSAAWAEERAAVDFARDVVSALTKSGCNAGACHGSFQGRGGLRLSLLGFDPEADYQTLVKDARGRRIFPAVPSQSLFLRKPTLAVPHGGGERLTPDSPAYQILVAWISQGLVPPKHDLRVSKLDISPTELVLKSGQSGPIKVTATWSDGVQRDVTAWTQFELREESVASVSPAGVVTAASSGRVAVSLRYAELVAAVPVTVPFENSPAAEPFVPNNYIDKLVAAEWQKLSLSPVPTAKDEEFVRRVYLDLIGTLPTPDDVRKFVADTALDKRAKLIDELLKRPEYVDYWALKWSDLLRAHRRALGEKGMASFSGWLRQRLRENAPFDKMAGELITAEGNLYGSGPVAYYFVDKTPEDLAETTAQIFLGVRLTCAKCHHHPFEAWGQDDYFSLASFFSGVTRKDNKEAGAFGGAQAVRMTAGAPLKHPRTGIDLPPKAFGWTPPAAPAGSDPRKALAGWLVGKENPRFARTVVNRYWGYMLGRGLVHPIDDLSATNPPVFPAVLDALAADFVAHGHDLKHLLRTICNSRVYQLASDVKPAVDVEGQLFTRRIPFRLPAEVLLDAINQAAGTHEGFANLPPETRAISLPDSNVDSYFLNSFGRPRRTSTCECERGGRLDLSQVLHLANGDALQAKLASPTGRLAKLLASGGTDEALIEELYLATLSRRPTAAELATAGEFLKSLPSKKEAVEDLLWTLLNSPEFVMNH